MPTVTGQCPIDLQSMRAIHSTTMYLSAHPADACLSYWKFSSTFPIFSLHLTFHHLQNVIRSSSSLDSPRVCRTLPSIMASISERTSLFESPSTPRTSEQWKKALEGVKLLYLRRQYKQCAARAAEILRNANQKASSLFVPGLSGWKLIS